MIPATFMVRVRAGAVVANAAPARSLKASHRMSMAYPRGIQAAVSPWSAMFSLLGAEAITIRNGLYSLGAVSIDGVDAEVGGVLIHRDGQISGRDSLRGSKRC